MLESGASTTIRRSNDVNGRLRKAISPILYRITRGCWKVEIQTEGDKLHAALKRLGAVLSGIVATAEEKNKERCPYRTVHDLCTFAGGCQNQRRTIRPIACAGDHLLKRTGDPGQRSRNEQS